MPEISRFYGVIIYMYFKDHFPPHIHLRYGDYEAIIYLKDGVVVGEMPGKIVKMALKWMELNRIELLKTWKLAQKGESLPKIKPLKI